MFEIKTMSLVIPDEFLQTAHISEATLKLEIAILLFGQEKITLGAASQFADMNQLEFNHILGSRKITIHYGIEEFRQDLRTLEANNWRWLLSVKPLDVLIQQVGF